MGRKEITIIVILFATFIGLYQNELRNTYSTPIEGALEVYFLDVGQADSILIKNQQESMLIDAGNNEDGNLLVNYFNSLNIPKFKYLIGTHPHEDHIGGLDDIINNFQIDNIYLPDAITTTQTFVDVVNSIENKNMTYKVPQIGEKLTLGDATLEIIYTGTNQSDLNDTSIVVRLDYGNVSFLFTGDISSKVEKTILYKNIDVDILKVGHHGSSYGTTDSFLTRVSPDYAIISVGTPNSYNHPSTEVLNKLKEKNIQIHRTDEEGTILVTTDGNNINITNIKTNTNG